MHSLQMSLLSEKEYRQIDRVFQMALCEFHASLVSTYSLSLQVSSGIAECHVCTVYIPPILCFDLLTNRSPTPKGMSLLA